MRGNRVLSGPARQEQAARR